ncbi:hypothetical protein A3D84_01800 [Candidatus Woesebacteria bacterium RIFCSPHIGHO2_02_FULL_42_20]|uniref:PDZ domain-containing protein n=1 Tax=Candidatus Woesebacteria bacterium RIFCSPHIGHO2_12_FULL_41_24 TaxID=1802510 RepID=A0A1F8AR48_9BACT|nr:MAG: hypothetical protein A2W15_06010 [Candidatus Woesebacteria bacterium RBG_16_41_13]OGM29828.1 MAG: hypothetical protein A2873_04285 [Candidatus Woesebacteria bacterium RIFCSPHIGHO2_01_FULL_42_80]OGM35967.1 MAG: hypothetical protein A3D84_01800 [Candidatus Woesebacteria bacterium RIFCSPHIGHO2_02_FULL_42_20]OGM54141.1 MAG: hypothetical protein A3E44_00460 [Candidatus Woesebacteria bacterium RIFCSPHIGHO2_12_FULL_41_24]OGM66477.1 MAG: hypothetical protein A2969_02495 [Candidatus Woesebacteri
MRIKKYLIVFAFTLVVVTAVLGGALADRLFGLKPLDFLVKRDTQSFKMGNVDQRILNEESVVISVAENVSPSVVTVSIKTPERSVLQYDLFGGLRRRVEGGQEQDIGTGFVISEDGLIVTNKHVVSDAQSSYKVITKDDKEYDVKQISRDPLNDLAILKVDPSLGSNTALKPIDLGDSDNLKVGQFVVAIGTALGEFRHTVTTGVISGLGRGITAGDPFEGSVERLDGVIQTDAAINPGNSGGPLLNSAGQVIGVNVAVAQTAQNIGFAIPINVVKKALQEFERSGKFASKPFLGVKYQTISQDTANLNAVPQGAYIVEVVAGSPAENAGVVAGDIVTKIDTEQLGEDKELSDVVGGKFVGSVVTLEIWRDNATLSLSATLSEFSE